VSNGTVFPTSDLISWSAEYRMRLQTSNGHGIGVGIANVSTEVADSLVATYKMMDDPGYLRLYADGKEVWNTYTALYDLITYRLEYNASSRWYSVYVDGVNVANFTSQEMAKKYWLGTNSPGLPAGKIQGMLLVDFVRLRTLSGGWTSSSIDMGHAVVVDSMDLAWNSSQPEMANTTLWVSTSMDNETWGPWSILEDGHAVGAVTGRYVRFRVVMGLPQDAPMAANVRVDGIHFGYHFPLTSISYRQNDLGWVPMDTCSTWNFSADLQEGVNNFTVRAIDTRGMVTVTHVDLVLDTTAPTGTVSINWGDAWCNDRNVTLVLDAMDKWAVPTVELSNDPVNLLWHARPFNTTVEWRVPDMQGEVMVYARFTDEHGLVSSVCTDTIMYDPVTPTARVEIDRGAVYSGDTLVQVALEYSDLYPIGSLLLSNSADMAGAVELPPGTTAWEWDLGVTEDGEAFCYFQVTDLAGNAVVVSDSIEVHLPRAVGTLEIEDGARLVSGTFVRVVIDVPKEVRPSSMQFSEDPDFAGAEWEAFAEEKLLPVSEGDGEKTIYFRVEDFRGLVQLPVNASIVIDNTPPVVTASLNGGAEYAVDPRVQVVLTFEDANGPGMTWVGLEEDLSDAEAVPFKALHNITLPAGEGVHVVYARVEDEVGNGVVVSDTIHLATIKPLITLSLPGGNPSNAVGSIEVEVEVHDSYGSVEVQLEWDQDPNDLSEWRDPGGPLSVTIPADTSDGVHQIRARARNLPGLESDVVTLDVQLDRTPLTLAITKPADGAKVTSEGKIVRVHLEIDDVEGMGEIQYRLDGGEWVDATLEEDTLVLGIPTFGEHTLDVRVVDRAGNEAISTSTFKLEEAEEAGTPGVAMVLAVMAVLVAGLVVRGRR
jgi:hypothetical protein